MAKKRTMNELRQTKEYYVAKQKVLSDGGFDTNEEMKQIAACVKEIAEIDPIKQIMAQQIDEEMKECPLDTIEEAKILIVNEITTRFQDVMFEMINEAMMDYPVFQSQNYLTEAGYDLFEDEYFEFYHEHHGDILYEVMKNSFNQPSITN